MFSIFIDNFDIAGEPSFVDMISGVQDVSKVEDDKFRFTGIDIRKMENGIEISMEDQRESLEEIEIREDRSDETLTKDELEILRKYVGKLNWLKANT